MPDPVDAATALLGTPYVWGGNSVNGVDCSGLIQQIYPSLPRVAHLQKQATSPVTQDQLQKGDLVFLHGTQKNPPVPADWASHVGVYDGNGNVIHASSVAGKVISVPLTRFTSSPQFYGFGRPNTMPKTKATPTSIPQPTPTPDVSGAFGANGKFDPQAFVAAMLSQRNQPVPSLYDPTYQPTIPNPGYNPTPQPAPQLPSGDLLSLLDADPSQWGQQGQAQNGPVMPQQGYDDRQYIQGPSDIQQAQNYQMQAVQQAPTPTEIEAAKIENQAKLLKAHAQVLRDNPPPQYNMPDFLPMPQRQFAPIPTRPAPQFDMPSGVLGLLAGLVDPRNAGQYNAMPLEAGINVANQQYNDRRQQYEMAAQQLQQQYEAELANRNAQNDYQNRAAGVQYENANNTRNANVQTGNFDAEGTNDLDYANALQDIGQREKAGQISATQAQFLREQIATGMQQNQAKVQLYNADQNRENTFLKTMMGYGTGIFRSQNQLQGVNNKIEGQKSMLDDVIAQRTAAATQRAETAIKVAEIRANAVLGNKKTALPPGLQLNMQRQGQVWANAKKQVGQALQNAEKAYQHDSQLLQLPKDANGNPVDKATYMQMYTAPFVDEANKAYQDYQTTLDAIGSFAPPVPGTVTPPVTPPAGGTTPPTAPTKAAPPAAPPTKPTKGLPPNWKWK